MITETPLVQEFLKEGEIKGKIEDISAVIEFRFGSVPEELHSKLELIEDVERLSELHRQALACETLRRSSGSWNEVAVNIRFAKPGERKVITETPLVQEFLREGEIKGQIKGKIKSILAVIEFRFGSAQEELRSKLELIEDVERLCELLQAGLACESLEAFERELE